MASHVDHPARIAAIAADVKTFRGPPCFAHGEVERWASTGGCIDCGRERSRDYARAKAATRDRLPVASDPAREKARAAGKRTWRGRPCRHGHDGIRYVKNAGCVHCARERSK